MNIEDHYQDVATFNRIAGNFDNVDEASLAAQIKVVVEEVAELNDAFSDKNAVEMLDGVCDAFVTVAGLMQKMEVAGFNVDEALKRVCENNLEKFPKTIPIPAAASYFDNKWQVKYNSKYDCYVLKDQNGKIRKPLGFQSVVLDDLVPKSFFGGAV